MKIAIEGLYAITPESRDTRALLAKVKSALQGGAQLVQYRTKIQDAALKHEQASELLVLCRQYHVPLIVNDDVRLATLIDADGVHLGATDAPLKEARINLGPDKIIGVSCYQDLELASRAAAASADYVAFGSFFPSPTKPEARLCEPALLSAAKAKLTIPVVAIGGITPANAQSLITAGANAIAVISALFDASDIELSAHYFARFFATLH
jgi:thiamine-phosphate pyrophosphorylase